MTTIAARLGERRGEVAADRRLSVGTKHDPTHKIVRVTDRELGPIIVGASGDWNSVLKARKWIERGRRGRMPSTAVCTLMVVVLSERRLEEWESQSGTLIRTALARSYHAIGSGASEAKAAMYVGASPRRAIFAAASVDLATGDGVDVVRFVFPRGTSLTHP
jgi:hypothetical protein